MTNKFILSPIFSDGAILQSGKPVAIFGFGEPGQIVQVKLGSEILQTIISDSGKWQVKFNSKPACWETTLTVKVDDDLIERRVTFGEVYLFSGQSNIEYKMEDDADYLEEKARFSTDNIKLYYTPQIEFEESLSFNWQSEELPRWKNLTQDNLGEVSAVAFYAVKKISKDNPNVPIGILECFKGGTSASSWISETNLKSDSVLKQTYLDKYHSEIDGKSEKDFVEEKRQYESLLESYNSKKAEFIEQHPEMSLEEVKMHVGHTPWPPPMDSKSYLRPNGLYHTMFLKVAPYTVKKMVWYQGENDAENSSVYELLLPRLITEWRRDLEDNSLPVYVVQLPQYMDEPENAWAEIRQAQWKVVKNLANVNLVSIVDTGEHHNIHPISKSLAGNRLGEVMESRFYDSTPIIVDYSVFADRLVLIANSSLDLKAQNSSELELKIDGKWQMTTDFSVGGKLISIPMKTKIDAVRYAYSNAPAPTIFNEVGYPLSPFLIEL